MTTTGTTPKNTLYPLVPGRTYWATEVCTCGGEHTSHSYRVTVMSTNLGSHSDPVDWRARVLATLDGGEGHTFDIYTFATDGSDNDENLTWAFGSDADRIDFEPLPYEVEVDGYTVTVHPECGYDGVEYVRTVMFGESGQPQVYGPRKAWGGQVEPAQVNWSAIGSVPADEAELYGRALLAAAKIAANLNDGVAIGTDR